MPKLATIYTGGIAAQINSFKQLEVGSIII